MDKAYFAITDVGPFRARQVVVLDEQDGWTRTGYLHELPDPKRPVVAAPGEILMRIVLPEHHSA